MIGGTVFSGFSNYTQALSDGPFGPAWVGHSLRCHTSPVMVVIATFFATIFDMGVARFGGAFRAVFFLPFAVPGVVATAMWGSMLQTRVGVFVRIFLDLGLPDPNFFGPGHLLGVIVVIAIWEWTGFTIILLYTALKSVHEMWWNRPLSTGCV